MNPTLVLASSSAARKRLMDQLQLDYRIEIPDVDETPFAGERAEPLVQRLACLKAQTIADKTSNEPRIIIGSDSLGEVDGHFLGKPGSFERAVEQLSLMAGKACVFHCGLCVINTLSQRQHCYHETVTVHMRALSLAEIKRYVSKEPAYHCAGSLHIETLGITLVKAVENQDPSTLIGMPLIKLCELLREEGVAI